MLKAFTTDYEHFADDKTGLLPYLANVVKKLIQEEDNEKLQRLVDDIARTAENLYDLNDEVLVVKQKYDQMKNRREAIDRTLEAQLAAKAALDSEMQKEFGIDEDAIGNPLDELIGIDAEPVNFTPTTPDFALTTPETHKIVQPTPALDLPAAGFGAANADGVIQPPAASQPTPVISSLAANPARDEELVANDAITMLEHMSIEDMIDPQYLPGPSDDDLRAEGLIFGDEIDELVHDNATVEDEEIDDEIYDNFDIGDEDVDGGYKPLEEVGISAVSDEASEPDEDPFYEDEAAEEDLYDDPLESSMQFDIDALLGDDADLGDLFDDDDLSLDDDTGLPQFGIPDDEEDDQDDEIDTSEEDLAGGSNMRPPIAGSVDSIFQDDDDDDIPGDAGFFDVTQL